MNDLIGSLFTLIGGGLILWQVLDMVRAAESRNWPHAPGRVLRKFVDREEGDEGPKYLVKVLCQYKVGDSEYTCRRLRFGIPLWSSTPLTYFSRAWKKYAAGDFVEIYYNPEKPEDSVLEPGFALTLLSGLVFSFLVFAAGILTLRQG